MIELDRALRTLGLHDRPVIAHASLKAFGSLPGGPRMLVDAMLDAFGTVIMPAHTYKTMVNPGDGPAENGIVYGQEQDLNRMAEFWSKDMPVDPLIGTVAETLRRHPHAGRSTHPILSFTGVGADEYLRSQSLSDPLAPIGRMAEHGGWVILLGVGHTANTSIHYGEKLAGREQFTRWALTEEGIVACPGFPGCSAGFDVIAPDLKRFTLKIYFGDTLIQAIPLNQLFGAVAFRLHEDPLSMLCQDSACPRCLSTRRRVVASRGG